MRRLLRFAKSLHTLQRFCSFLSSFFPIFSTSFESISTQRVRIASICMIEAQRQATVNHVPTYVCVFAQTRASRWWLIVIITIVVVDTRTDLAHDVSHLLVFVLFYCNKLFQMLPITRLDLLSKVSLWRECASSDLNNYDNKMT